VNKIFEQDTILLKTAFIFTVIVSALPLIYAQENNSLLNTDGLNSIIHIFQSPQNLLDQLSIEFKEDISTIDLISFSLGMVLYGIFIWHFYRLIARREIVSLHLKKYESDGKKITSILVYLVKYIIVFPLIVSIWFFVYSMFMFFLAPQMSQDFVFLLVISLVVAIRIAAYYKEDLARDLAKLIPFSLLAIFLANSTLFTIDQVIEKLDHFVPFISKIVAFVIFAIGIEAVLRIIFLAKRKLLPVAEAKIEEEIEKTIDEKMKVQVKQIEKKIEKTEENLVEKQKQIEKKIEKTEDSLEEKHNQIEKKFNDSTKNSS
jgi:hypothetical protein